MDYTADLFILSIVSVSFVIVSFTMHYVLQVDNIVHIDNYDRDNVVHIDNHEHSSPHGVVNSP